MNVLTGKGVSEGIVSGRISFYKRAGYRSGKWYVEDTVAEWNRFENARLTAIGQLQDLCKRAVKDIGREGSMIFEAHEMILKDLDYIESVKHIVEEQKVNAEYAVSAVSECFAAMFSTMEDIYMQGRSADIKDVSQCVINILSGAKSGELEHRIDQPVIVAADDLSPSEIMKLDKKNVIGIATWNGTLNSHTTVLAKIMRIPMVICLGEELRPEYEGAFAVIDGCGEKIYIEPDEITLERMLEKQAKENGKKATLLELKGKESIARSGQRIELYASINDGADVEAAIQNDAGGIGLLRSESFYLGRDSFPTEEQQFQVYREAAEKMAGKKVIIRTLDIGADKQADYFHLDKEVNPALGYRGIRICLDQPDIFKTQLRALLRASFYGQIGILFPMIISVDEVKEIKKILGEVKAQLRKDGIGFDEALKIGIMIETPAAVMESRKLAKEVDFFSVGTNDLTQYTLAVDRQNPKLERFYDAHHPAVLAMIRMAAENAHAEGKRISICGELAADLKLTETFLSMGIDELSVIPSMILPLRKKVREIK